MWVLEEKKAFKSYLRHLLLLYGSQGTTAVFTISLLMFLGHIPVLFNQLSIIIPIEVPRIKHTTMCYMYRRKGFLKGGTDNNH